MTTYGETATIERRGIATGGAQHAEASSHGAHPTGILVVQLGADAKVTKVFRAHEAVYHSRKKYYMQSIFPQELKLDYSHRRVLSGMYCEW